MSSFSAKRTTTELGGLSICVALLPPICDGEFVIRELLVRLLPRQRSELLEGWDLLVEVLLAIVSRCFNVSAPALESEE